jgi:hypothetical protein
MLEGEPTENILDSMIDCFSTTTLQAQLGRMETMSDFMKADGITNRAMKTLPSISNDNGAQDHGS